MLLVLVLVPVPLPEEVLEAAELEVELVLFDDEVVAFEAELELPEVAVVVLAVPVEDVAELVVSELEESLLVDLITFSEEISAWSPSHFFWITLITPPLFNELSASETACCKAVLVVVAATL